MSMAGRLRTCDLPRFDQAGLPMTFCQNATFETWKPSRFIFFTRSRRHNSSTTLLCPNRRAVICASYARSCSRRLCVVQIITPHLHIMSSGIEDSVPQYWHSTLSVVIMVWSPLVGLRYKIIMLQFNMIIFCGAWRDILSLWGHVIPRHGMIILCPYPYRTPP